MAVLGGAALAAGGCGGHGRRAPTVLGTRLIYTSLPSRGPYAATANAVFDGEQLALSQAGGFVRGYRVVLRRLDDGGAGMLPTATSVAASARVAAGDESTIAYIGDLVPGSSTASIPILSAAGILQVSPGDSASPIGPTFARVVPSVADEATAQLQQLTRRTLTRVYLLQDHTTYGRELASAIASDAPDYGIEVVDPTGAYLTPSARALVKTIKHTQAEALLYAGLPTSSLTTLWNTLAISDGHVKKFASAAVALSPSWALTTVQARLGTFLSTPGLAQLPRAGTQFESDFTDAYGERASWASAIFGYVAMSGVLEAMYRLGPMAGDRARVASTFLHTRNVASALGPYSIDAGQTTFNHFFFTTYARNGALIEPPATG